MKRFLLFCFENYYPLGGMNDFVKDFDSTKEALDHAQDNLHELLKDSVYDYAWIQVFDTELNELVFEEEVAFNENNKLMKELNRTIFMGKLSSEILINKNAIGPSKSKVFNKPWTVANVNQKLPKGQWLSL